MKTAICLLASISALTAGAAEHVILLHGLGRSPGSMNKMAAALVEAGYTVDNVGYESQSAAIHELATATIGDALETDAAQAASKVHFVTHSLGGILVRDYLASHSIPKLGRVVMLAPPNNGSEIVDHIGGWFLFRWINGPAGQELGTGSESVPVSLGKVNFTLGVIAGDRSINWIGSLMIPGPDDGTVAVSSTRVEGSTDHIVVHATHPFIMKNRAAIRQTRYFLRHGTFHREDEDASRRESARKGVLAVTDLDRETSRHVRH